MVLATSATRADRKRCLKLPSLPFIVIDQFIELLLFLLLSFISHMLLARCLKWSIYYDSRQVLFSHANRFFDGLPEHFV